MQYYTSSITAQISANEAFDRITRISDWWTAGVQGSSCNLGDQFTVRWGETFVTFKVTELAPGRRAVWLVTDCNIHFIADRTEWKGTRVVWDLSSKKGETNVTMTHVGLVPGLECYHNCVAGWNFYIGESLLKLLTEGKGLADQREKKTQKSQA
jgi:hypothetical protein